MKNHLIPKSALVGFILGALIAAGTFAFPNPISAGIIVLTMLVPEFLISQFTQSDTFMLTMGIMYFVWIALFCIVGGAVMPLVSVFVCSYAKERTCAKMKKISDIVTAICFTPYCVFALIVAVGIILASFVMIFYDDYNIILCFIAFSIFAAIIFAVSKIKLKMNNESGCTVLIISLILHAVFIVGRVFQFVYSKDCLDDWAVEVCLLFAVVCAANFVITVWLKNALLRDGKIAKLPRALLTAMCGVSCLYAITALVSAAACGVFDYHDKLLTSCVVMLVASIPLFVWLGINCRTDKSADSLQTGDY